MKRITYWWPLAKSLVAFLNVQMDAEGKPLFGDAKIYAGTKGTAKPSYPCIEVSYDGESEIPVSYPICRGNVVLWIDVWVKSSSSNPEDAYDLQDTCQQNIFAALKLWPKDVLDTLGIAVKLIIKEIASDGDAYRPASGARIVLEVEWRNSR